MMYQEPHMTPVSAEFTELPAPNPRSIIFGSGREVSKLSLFKGLQAGGWAAAYVVCSLAAEVRFGLWPALFNPFIWAVCGCLVTLGTHRVYRRSRRLKHSYVVFAAVALASSVLLAPLWYFLEQISLRAALSALLHVDVLRPVFAQDAVRTARDPLFFSIYLWPFYSIILFTWASLYFGVNAILELESERAKVVNALKLADTARLRALQSNLNPHFLFNALNGIATLVREHDSVTAAAM